MTFTSLEDARRTGFFSFMFTTEAARAEFAATRPGGVAFTEEFHSRGDVFRLFCLAFQPRAGQHEFVRATDRR